MRLLCALLVCAAAGGAAPVQISDTIKTPFTNILFEGLVYISGPKMTTAAGDTIVAWQAEYRITAGQFAVQLEPNDTATPAGTSYSVRYIPASSRTKAGAWTETWVVRTSAAPLKVHQVRVATIPTPGVIIQPQQIASGGAAAGQCLAWGGSSWLPVACGGNGDKIQGRAVAPTEPAPGQVLAWDGSRWAVATPAQWDPPAAPILFDGQLLRWNAAVQQWQPVTLVDQETPSGAIDGANTVFELVGAPSPAAGLILFRNGIVQKRGVDYALAGATITFLATATPQPGDILLAWYRY